ncbi:MAG: CoA-binding protein [Pirellulaceae bacterium]
MSIPNDGAASSSLSLRQAPTVAIVGASPDRTKYGNKSVRAHLQQGYQVFPVNPRGGEIEGLPVYRSLSEIPVSLDRISLYVPPQVGMQLLPEIAAKGCRELWFNPGSESDELIEQAYGLGLEPIVACSIVDVGVSPSQFGP